MERRKIRVVVFIDGQNVHQDFRRAFCAPGDSARIGAFDPLALATRLATRGPDFEEWTLTETRIYVGSPIASRERTAAMAHDRQVSAWKAAGIAVRPRPLLYPEDWPRQKARQKGVDVELAVDVVRMAIGGGSRPTPRICVVSYDGLPKRLRLPDARGPALYSFQLSREDFEAVQDLTDYRVSADSD